MKVVTAYLLAVLGGNTCPTAEDLKNKFGLVISNVYNLGTVLHAIISTICVIVYFCCFIMGYGPIPNILCSEIFPTRVRGLCIATCALVYWICDIIVTYTLPVMLTSIGLAGVFGIYAVICVITWFFVYAKVPETKGIPLEVITEFFAVGTRQVGRIHIIAFQSLDRKETYMSGPASLTPIIDIGFYPGTSENLSSRSSYVWVDSLEQDTGDSRATTSALKAIIDEWASSLFRGEALGNSVKGLMELLQAVRYKGNAGLGWDHNRR